MGGPSAAAEAASGHLKIVRCEIKEDARIVAAYQIALYGSVRQTAQYIRTEVVPVSEYWVKISEILIKS